MKQLLYKIEHENLILKKNTVIPYLLKSARDSFKEYLDIADSPFYANSIFRYTRDQIPLYRKWMEGLRKFNGDADKAKEHGYVLAAKPGWSCHEVGSAVDNDSIPDNANDTNYTKNWQEKKYKLANYGWSGIRSEHWHIQHITPFSNATDYIKSFITETLTDKDIWKKLSDLNYTDVKQFQKDYGLITDGVVGVNTITQLILLTKEIVFVD